MLDQCAVFSSPTTVFDQIQRGFSYKVAIYQIAAGVLGSYANKFPIKKFSDVLQANSHNQIGFHRRCKMVANHVDKRLDFNDSPEERKMCSAVHQ